MWSVFQPPCMLLKARPHCNLNPGLTRVTCVHTELSFDEFELNPGWSQPHPDVGWNEFNPGWRKCGFLVSDFIHACTGAIAMRSKEMTGRQQRGYSLVFGAQPMCIELAYDHLKTLPRFPRVLPMYIWQSFGSLWRIVSVMASNSGGSSSNSISRRHRHMVLIMNNELPWTS